MKIGKIKQSYIDNLDGEIEMQGYILVNPKTERELFLDGSLNKSENIDDHITIRYADEDGDVIINLKTVITEKVEDFLIL